MMRSLITMGAGALLLTFGCGDDAKPQPTPPGNDSCSAAVACETGKVCLDGTCVAGESRGLVVPGNARGCELLLTDAANAKVAAVSFGAGVKGSFVRRAPRTGVSLIADGDHPIEETGANLVLAGDGDPALSKVQCVDANGNPLPNAAVSFAD